MVIVTERQAGENCIEIRTWTAFDWFRPYDIQEPCSAFRNTEGGTAGAVRFYNGNRLFVGIKVGELDRGTCQYFALINNANWQVTRLAKGIWVTFGYNLERQSDSFCRAQIRAPGASPHADQYFGTAAIKFTPSGIYRAGTVSIFQYWRQPLVLGIIIEALRRQFGRRPIGLHREHVNAGLDENGKELRANTTLFEGAAQVGGAVGANRFQHDNATCVGLPPATVLSVADQRGNRQCDTRIGSKRPWLQPKIVRSCRSSYKDDRQFRQSEAHVKQFLSNNNCSVNNNDKKTALSIPLYLKTRVCLKIIFTTALLFTSSVPAYAHQQADTAGGIAAGFSHPFLGLDHMLAMIAVGIWGAFLGKPLLVILPMVFPVMMTVGAAVAMLGMPFPPVEFGIALSVIVLGVMIVTTTRAVPVVACAIVGVFALFHGYAHGVELPEAADPVGYSVGFVLATGLLHLVGIGLGLFKDIRFGEFGLRAAGGAIAAVGAMYLVTGLLQ